MFGSDQQKLETQIGMDSAKLQADISKNALDEQISKEQELLEPMQLRKQMLADQTAEIQRQADVAKTTFDIQKLQQKELYDQAVAQFVTTTATTRGLSPADVKAVLKSVGLTDSAADKAAAMTATLEDLKTTQFGREAGAGTGGANSFTGGGGTAINAPVAAITHQWNVEINNPQMDSATGVDATITAFRAGLEEAAAAGSPIAPLGSSTDIP